MRGFATRFRDERGSIPFAMLVVVVTILTTSMLATTLTWQARSASREQARQDARWAADSATSLALERLSSTTPLLAGVPVVDRIPTSPDQGPPWNRAPDTSSAMRWYAVRSTNVNDITVIAEGRTTDNYPVTYASVIAMRYDFGAGGWVAYRISSNITDAADAAATG